MEISMTSNDWWRGAVIYQIYPRSFQDSNGDGVGDLMGIASRLDYVASLNVDAIWISPFFKSPMKDFGYDVSDYRDIDPMFGNPADFDILLKRAHELGLKVMIDLVLSHSSDQHPWFIESHASRDNPKSDWYVWADPKPDGTPPNNWLSIFGGPAWQWDPRREQYYLHNFLVSQPDFNFHNFEVQNALLDIARFWMECGVDGFRLDTINFYVHDQELRSNPPLLPELRNASIAPLVNPYNHQEHLYSKNRPENLKFIERLRALGDEYGGRALLGEIGDANRGLELLGEYTKGDKRAHMSYAFELLEGTPLTAGRLAEIFAKIEAVATDGWACWAYSNHDVRRHKTRWMLDDGAVAAYTALQMCLRGSVCLYQGEELGFEEAEVAFEDLQDPYGIEFWPEFKGRDGCRTPMAWEHNANNGGFSTMKPWLPVADAHIKNAANLTNSKKSALIHHYRRAIALRRNELTLAKGKLSPIVARGDVAEFTRTYDGETICCVFNLGDAEQKITPLQNAQNLGEGLTGAVNLNSNKLEAWQYIIAKTQ